MKVTFASSASQNTKDYVTQLLFNEKALEPFVKITDDFGRAAVEKMKSLLRKGKIDDIAAFNPADDSDEDEDVEEYVHVFRDDQDLPDNSSSVFEYYSTPWQRIKFGVECEGYECDKFDPTKKTVRVIIKYDNASYDKLVGGSYRSHGMVFRGEITLNFNTGVTVANVKTDLNNVMVGNPAKSKVMMRIIQALNFMAEHKRCYRVITEETEERGKLFCGNLRHVHQEICADCNLEDRMKARKKAVALSSEACTWLSA